MSTVGAIFLATPFYGTDAASPASWLVVIKRIMGEQASDQLIQDLNKRHGYIWQRIKRFAELANADALRLPICCFFETLETNIASKTRSRPKENRTFLVLDVRMRIGPLA